MASSSSAGGPPAGDGIEHSPVTTPLAAETPGRSARAYPADDLEVREAESAPAAQTEDDDEDEEEDEDERTSSKAKESDQSSSEQDRERQQKLEERRQERELLMHQHVSLTHSDGTSKFFPYTMGEGCKAWTDRKYTYGDVPKDMVDAVFLSGPYKVPPGELTLTIGGDLWGTAYIWSEGRGSSEALGDLEEEEEDQEQEEEHAEDGQEDEKKGWKVCDDDEMKFLDDKGRGTDLRMWKRKVRLDIREFKIPIYATWIGGIAFHMAPDDQELTPPPSEVLESEVPPRCWEVLMALWFKHWNRFLELPFVVHPIYYIDNFIRTRNPLDRLEQGAAVRLHDAFQRARVEDELLRIALETQVIKPRPSCLLTGRGKLCCCRRKKRNLLEHAKLDAEHVLEAYRRQRVGGRSHGAREKLLAQAYAGVLPPKGAAGVLLSRFCALAWLYITVHSIVLLLVFATNAVAGSPEGSGMLVNVPTSGVLSAGASVDLRPLWEYPQLSFGELRRIDDVIFVHNQAVHVLRVARISRSNTTEVSIRSSDGSALRVRPDGLAFWTPRGSGGGEVFLTDVEARRKEADRAGIEGTWLASGTLAAHVASS